MIGPSNVPRPPTSTMKIMYADQLTLKIDVGSMKSVFASVSAPAAPQPSRGEHEQDALAGDHAHAERRRGLLVVADRLQRRAERGCAAARRAAPGRHAVSRASSQYV